MIPITQIKTLIYGVILAISALGIWYYLNSWHYKPIKDMSKKIIELEIILKETGRQLNVCEANLSKQALQGYIDGVGEHNEEPIIDFSNIVY